MGKTLVIFLISLLSLNLALASGPHNHEEEDLTEKEILIQLLEGDIQKDLEKIHLLYNSILSKEVDKNKKCGFTAELSHSLTVLDFALNQYMYAITKNAPSQFSDSDFSSPSGISIRQMKVYQIKDRMRIIEKSAEIFSKNNSCPLT